MPEGYFSSSGFFFIKTEGYDMILATNNWAKIAWDDLKAAHEQLEKNAIYTTFPCMLEQNYAPALRKAQDVASEEDYEKAMQELILAEKVDFLRFNFKSGKVATPAGIEVQKVPGKVSVQLDANTATLKFPHFLRDRTDEWKQLEETVGEIRKKERIVIDLSEYVTGATAVAMEVFGKLFGKNFWEALYDFSRRNPTVCWKVSPDNIKSLEEQDRSQLPVAHQKYFAEVIAKMKVADDEIIETIEPEWNTAKADLKHEVSLLQGKKIFVITNCARGVAREMSIALKTIPGTEHQSLGTEQPQYFSDYRTVTLPSGTTLSFPRKLIGR